MVKLLVMANASRRGSKGIGGGGAGGGGGAQDEDVWAIGGVQSLTACDLVATCSWPKGVRISGNQIQFNGRMDATDSAVDANWVTWTIELDGGAYAIFGKLSAADSRPCTLRVGESKKSMEIVSTSFLSTVTGTWGEDSTRVEDVSAEYVNWGRTGTMRIQYKAETYSPHVHGIEVCKCFPLEKLAGVTLSASNSGSPRFVSSFRSPRASMWKTPPLKSEGNETTPLKFISLGRGVVAIAPANAQNVLLCYVRGGDGGSNQRRGQAFGADLDRRTVNAVEDFTNNDEDSGGNSTIAAGGGESFLEGAGVRWEKCDPLALRPIPPEASSYIIKVEGFCSNGWYRLLQNVRITYADGRVVTSGQSHGDSGRPAGVCVVPPGVVIVKITPYTRTDIGAATFTHALEIHLSDGTSTILADLEPTWGIGQPHSDEEKLAELTAGPGECE